MECKARLRGLWRIIYSKTIISVYTLLDTGISCDTGALDRGQHKTGVNVSENLLYLQKSGFLVLSSWFLVLGSWFSEGDQKTGCVV